MSTQLIIPDGIFGATQTTVNCCGWLVFSETPLHLFELVKAPVITFTLFLG